MKRPMLAFILLLLNVFPTYGERRPTKMVFPTYPYYARHLEGTVIVTFQVTPDGKVESLGFEGDGRFYIPVSLALKKWVYPESQTVSKHRIEVRFKRVLAEGIDQYDEVSFDGTEIIEVQYKIPRTYAAEVP